MPKFWHGAENFVRRNFCPSKFLSADILSDKVYFGILIQRNISILVITKKKCVKVVDVCFMLDASGSIDKFSDWIRVKNFVRRLASV